MDVSINKNESSNHFQCQQLEIVNIPSLLTFYAEHQPQRVAYTFLKNGADVSCTLTYHALDIQSKNIAKILLTNMKHGDRALLLYHHYQDFIPVFLGCLYAGVIAVPVYIPNTPKSDLTNLIKIISNIQVNVVLTTELVHDFFKKDKIFHQCVSRYEIYFTDMLTNLLSLNELKKIKFGKHLSLNDIAYLQYTSGSTGNPKGVKVSHGNIIHNQSLIQKSFGTTQQDKIVSWLPFYHDMGLIGGILHPLYLGAECILMSPFSFIQKPSRWLETISNYQASVSGAPNFAYDICCQRIKDYEIKGINLECWRVAFNGAEKVRAQTIDNFSKKFLNYGFKNKSFYPTYGFAEGTLFATGKGVDENPIIISVIKNDLENNKIVISQNENNDNDNDKSLKLVSVGKSFDEQEVIIVDVDNLKQCNPCYVGEIWIKGKSITSGYWNNDDETRRCFDGFLMHHKGPYFKTGDLGFYYDNNLYITGRIKDLLIVNGRNIYPEDVEYELQHSIKFLKKGGGAVFSFDTGKAENIVFVQEIERECIRKLNEEIIYEIKCVVNQKFQFIIDSISLIMPYSLPKTTSGKVRREITKKLFLSGKLDEKLLWFKNEDIEKYCYQKRLNSLEQTK